MQARDHSGSQKDSRRLETGMEMDNTKPHFGSRCQGVELVLITNPDVLSQIMMTAMKIACEGLGL